MEIIDLIEGEKWQDLSSILKSNGEARSEVFKLILATLWLYFSTWILLAN